jgi:hypothetical protein
MVSNMASEYEIEADVWRDEQPGDEPMLRVSARVRGKRPLEVLAVELWRRERIWQAVQVSGQEQGPVFAVTASGPRPVMGEGPWELRVRLRTSAGERTVSAGVERIRVMT